MKYLIAIALLIATPALAQQQQASPAEQALSTQLLETIQSLVSVRAALIDTQRKLAEAQEKIKQLEAKPAEQK